MSEKQCAKNAQSENWDELHSTLLETRAWVAEYKGEDWVMLVHGKTAAKAKSNFHRWNPGDFADSDYIDIRVRRVPGFDGMPFTYEISKDTEFYYTDLDTGLPLEKWDFPNDCECEICKRTQGAER